LGASGRAGVDVEGALARVHERMYQPGASRVPVEAAAGDHARFRRRSWTARGLAAAAAIIIAAGLYATRERRDAAAPAPARVVATGTGEIDSVTLGDGSRAILGAGSRLVVPASYDRERTVTLEGQAAFTVQHDATRPFTVHVGGVTVTDIGSVFGVR
ncbi:MAG: FecR family protein, partial [Gemmatimonadota bacterium]|nr:FecR family protein [Gemmatimonadota bacterium]